jgi:hypothetical protein
MPKTRMTDHLIPRHELAKQIFPDPTVTAHPLLSRRVEQFLEFILYLFVCLASPARSWQQVLTLSDVVKIGLMIQDSGTEVDESTKYHKIGQVEIWAIALNYIVRIHLLTGRCSDVEKWQWMRITHAPLWHERNYISAMDDSEVPLGLTLLLDSIRKYLIANAW